MSQIVLLVCLLPAAFLPVGLGAQQPVKLPQIGYLISAPLSASANRIEPFRQGLRELGYVEGKNITIEWRSAEGNRERQRALVAELLRLKSDIIVTGGSGPTRATKEATSTIPIVMTQSDDPIGSGFVVSLTVPGGNITGLSQLSPELSGKRLEILKEIVPKLSRVAVLSTSTSSSHSQVLREIEAVARSFGVTPQFVDVLTGNDLEAAFRAASKGRAEAILVLVSGNIRSPHRKKADAYLSIPGGFPTGYYDEITRLTSARRLLAIFHARMGSTADALASYGASDAQIAHDAARVVDKIAKGANAGELPVERPSKLQLVINLKTAKQIGLRVPPNVLARADRVIK